MWGRHGRFWGPFGFGFYFGFPRFGYPFMTKEEYLKMLEDYKKQLEDELKEVEKEIERVKRES